MLTIRLSRVGKKNHPQYRLVVQEKRKSPTGKAIKTLGYYHPLQKIFECDVALVEKYIKQGAKPSSTVAHLLQTKGMKGMERYMDKVVMKPKKTDNQKELESHQTVATAS